MRQLIKTCKRSRYPASKLLVLLCLCLTVSLLNLSHARAAAPTWGALLRACSVAGSNCSRLRAAFGERTLSSSGFFASALPDQKTAVVSGIIRLSQDERRQGEGWLKSRQTMKGQRAQLLRISKNYGILYQPSLGAQASTGLSVRPFWKRKLLLDKAAESSELLAAQADYGVDGQGVLFGVVDSGIDINHPDFLNAAGETRIIWYLVFDQTPTGKFPDLESQYGCVLRNDCAVYSAQEINEALASGLVGAIGPDRNGHGSHVASIAAGNGAEYPGVAPGADLIVVKAGNSRNGLSDERILLGAQFIQARAQALNQPVVTNLSLGSSFGAHDGRSPFEQALEELVEGPGHLLCVAAGNEAELEQTPNQLFEPPYGSHTEVTLSAEEIREVTFFGGGNSEEGRGSLFIWLRSARSNALSIAFDDRQGHQSGFVNAGSDEMFDSETLGDFTGDYEVLILNGDDSSLPDELDIDPHSAVVIISGSFAKNRALSFKLQGEGKTDLWLESSGDFGSSFGGFFFERSRAAGTVTMPGTAEGLITVGSSTNRNSWPTSDAEIFEFNSGVVGERSDFSGAGPNSLGALKPDIIAPGGSVVAAMSAVSDPRNSGASSNFSGENICPINQTNCLVVDDLHAVSIGTSMSSPLVAGALALLLSRAPELTQEEALQLLRASATSIDSTDDAFGQGAGGLDIARLLQAQDLRALPTKNAPDAETSRLVLADSFVRPGAQLEGLFLLRDSNEDAAGVASLDAFRIDAPAFAQVELSLGATQEPFGALELVIQIDEGTPAQSFMIDIYFRDEPFISKEVEIADEPLFPEFDDSTNDGGCSLTPIVQPSRIPLIALLLLGLGRLRKRPRS